MRPASPEIQIQTGLSFMAVNLNRSQCHSILAGDLYKFLHIKYNSSPFQRITLPLLVLLYKSESRKK